MAAKYPVGIDLGTTNSAAAYIDESGRTQIIRNSEGELLTPSVAMFAGDRIVVGRAARQAQIAATNHIAENAKRDMGRAQYRYPIRGQRFPPEVVQGYILRKLNSDILKAIGKAHEAVITVPAYFDEPRRKATADSGQMSGLQVLDIVNEPTAAALAFGEQLGYLDATGAVRDALTVLVYDLGGGTFDVTVIRLEPGTFTTLATDGDSELGGFNWDVRLVDHLVDRFQNAFPQATLPDEGNRRQLRLEAEAAKHRLTTEDETIVAVELQDRKLDVKVTRQDYESMTAELVERTAFTTRQAMLAAGVTWSDIDRLLLVGGSTRMPMIRRMLSAMAGVEPDVNVNPDEAVARGAAIYARHLLAQQGIQSTSERLCISDVNAHSLGIEGVAKDTMRRENAVLIPRNTPLPSEVHRTFVTKKYNQQSVKIQLLEGESTMPEHCTPLAKAAIRNLPPGLPEGTEVDVCYRFAANGRLSVEARVANQGHEAKIELERVRGLTDGRVDQWKHIISRDGGYDDFGDAMLDLLQEENDETPPVEPSVDQAIDTKEKRSLEPAIPYGAPAAAAETLKEERSLSQSTSKDVAQKRVAFFGRIIGHLVASVLGLVVGYYILCLIEPKANFLNIDLPGIQHPTAR